MISGPAMRSLRLAETQDCGSNVATDMKPVNWLAANDILRRRRRVLLQGGVQPLGQAVTAFIASAKTSPHFPIGNIPPAEAEHQYYTAANNIDMVSGA